MKEIAPYSPEIRFSDVDAYGVVHNAKYIVYMEQARIHWWRQAMGEGTWDWSKVGVLVAHHTIDYLRPVRLGDVLEVSSHIGAGQQEHGCPLRDDLRWASCGSSQDGACVL